VAVRVSQVSAQARTIRAPRGKAAVMVVHRISGKGSKITASTHQQRAVIFVNRRPNAPQLKIAEKKTPTQRIMTKVAGKAAVVRSKVADKNAPQRVRVALAARR
jgi:hypothetical protein